jgi:hypothetical protein
VEAINRMAEHLTWHFDAHAASGEGLRYYFLEIHPTYSRADVFAALKTLCRKEEISAYGLYEVYGQVDLVFSTWTPADRVSLFLESFKVLKDSIALRSHVRGYTIFDAEACCHHWLWDSGQENSRHRPGPESLAYIRQYEASSLKSETLLSPDRKTLLDELTTHNLVRLYDAKRPALRFFVTISRPPGNIPEDVRDHVTQRITEIVRSIEGIHHTKIYDSRGSIWLLIDATIAFDDYHAIANLQQRINESGVRQYLARTTTYLCTDNIRGVEEYEELNVRDRTPLPSVNESYMTSLLSRDESSQLEIKGSLRMNMRLFLAKGERKPEKDLEDKILATIVGFLNSSGGEVLIGALEADQERFAGESLASFETLPRVGKHRICGVDVDFLEKGGFDRFQIHLGNLLRDRIGVASSRIEIHHVALQQKSLCLLRVPMFPENQYLDKRHYFIRHGNSTRELLGADMEQYQRDRRR